MRSTPQETEAQRVSYPTVQSSPEAKEAEFHEATSSATVTEESQPNNQPPASDEETKKWGTHIMGLSLSVAEAEVAEAEVAEAEHLIS
ncbi:hypothetical protein D5086_021230 [Populus alba]|uniref:Uncharacterized protein n=1 Tax=Populus alba TaxID=43335 RepID=A0ACC4BD06_POPAL